MSLWYLWHFATLPTHLSLSQYIKFVNQSLNSVYICALQYTVYMYIHCNQERTCWLIYCSLQSPNVISSAQLDNLAMCTFHIFSFLVEEIDLTFITFLLSLWIEFYKHITRCNKLCSIGSSRNVYFPFMLRIQNIQTALNLFPLVPVHSKIYTVWHTHIQE